MEKNCRLVGGLYFSNKIRLITHIAVLSALAAILMIFTQITIIPSSFLKYDLSDVVVLLGGFSISPVAGVVIAFLKDFLFLIYKGDAFGIVGALMDFVATSSFVLVASCIYRLNKTKRQAIFSLIAGGLSMTVIMVSLNYIILSYFSNYVFKTTFSPSTIKALLVSTILPFNLLRATISSVIILLAYKKLKQILQ